MDKILALLMVYKYAIMLPLVVFEGPMVTILSGFLSSLHVMNPFIVYGIAVLGDFIGDAMFYGIGRFGKNFIHKHGWRISLTKKKLEDAKEYFASHHNRALVASKIVHGVGVTGLITAGVLKIPFGRYMRTTFFIALIQSAILVSIGMTCGGFYSSFEHYLNNFAAGASAIAVAVIGAIIFSKLKQKGGEIYENK